MDRYDRSHLADQTLLHSAATHAGHERTAMADLLADIAEIDARQLYLPAAYPSMYAFCVGELRLSEDAAFKRITAARTARRFPIIFRALAEGRLKLSGVCLLAARLTEDTATELLAAAMDQTNAQIERLLAARFPQSDVLPWVVATAPPALATPTAGEHAVRHVEEQLAARRVGDDASQGSPQAQPGQGYGYPRVTPLSAQSYGVQFTLSRSEHALVQYAQELLPGDVREVFLRALRVHVRQLEQGKFAATEKPRSACPRPTRSARRIPADVRRAVWQRDGGRCTFVSDTGHRCEARRQIQFDHIVEVARGGEATVSGIRLLCRAHNQHAAERTFGTEFMRHKRIAAAEARAAAKARAAAARARAAVAEQVPVSSHADAEDRDVVPWLRALGFSAAEARRAAERCEDIPDASLEERVRVALSSFRVRGTRVVAAGEGHLPLDARTH
jgi:5-methylcytosine-specific restriction endonuclease McrA